MEVEEENKCMVVGCDEKAEKTLDKSYKRVLQGLNLKVEPPDAKELHLCKRHYKMVKNAMRALRGNL
ncbi:hypothetical protein DRN39_08405 [Thermococci archaeon]|nr:MAG: hypothetical protein DRN39_08405 [Thermococci archaeon]